MAITTTAAEAVYKIVELSLTLDEMIEGASGTEEECIQRIRIRALDDVARAFYTQDRASWMHRIESGWVRLTFPLHRRHVIPHDLESNVDYLKALFTRACSLNADATFSAPFPPRLARRFANKPHEAMATLLRRITSIVTSEMTALPRLRASIADIEHIFQASTLQSTLEALAPEDLRFAIVPVSTQLVQTTPFLRAIGPLRSELQAIRQGSSGGRTLQQIQNAFILMIPRQFSREQDKQAFFDMLYELSECMVKERIQKEYARISQNDEIEESSHTCEEIITAFHELQHELTLEMTRLREHGTHYANNSEAVALQHSRHESMLFTHLKQATTRELRGALTAMRVAIEVKISRAETFEKFQALYENVRNTICEMFDVIQQLRNEELSHAMQEYIQTIEQTLREQLMARYMQLLRLEMYPKLQQVLHTIVQTDDREQIAALELHIDQSIRFFRAAYAEVSRVRDACQVEIMQELITALEDAKRLLRTRATRVTPTSTSSTTPQARVEQTVTGEGMRVTIANSSNVTVNINTGAGMGGVGGLGQQAASVFSQIANGTASQNILSTILREGSSYFLSYGPSIMYTTVAAMFPPFGWSLGPALVAGVTTTAGVATARVAARTVMPKEFYQVLEPFIDAMARLIVLRAVRLDLIDHVLSSNNEEKGAPSSSPASSPSSSSSQVPSQASSQVLERGLVLVPAQPISTAPERRSTSIVSALPPPPPPPPHSATSGTALALATTALATTALTTTTAKVLSPGSAPVVAATTLASTTLVSTTSASTTTLVPSTTSSQPLSQSDAIIPVTQALELPTLSLPTRVPEEWHTRDVVVRAFAYLAAGFFIMNQPKQRALTA